MNVTPLHVGTFEDVDKSTLVQSRGLGQKLRIPIVMWLVQSPSKTYLVDTGPPPLELTTARHGPIEQLPEQVPANALTVAGVDPAEVDAVVLTHLHFDHAGNLELCPNAERIVQRRELDYARDPLPLHARGYQHPSAGFEVDVGDLEWRVVDGDVTLEPGLELVLTPGHTPGLQAIVVDTPRERLVLASDNVPLEDNWRGEPPLIPHLPSPVHVDLREYHRSFAALERLGGRVVPGHDFRLFDYFDG